jgi:inner membrane protein
MDTITHAMMGLTLYGAIDKRNMSKEQKRAFFFATLVGSQIPDSDVISSLWDTNGRYQMWHRGITHSIFLVPVFALLISYFSKLIFKVPLQPVFYIAMLAVFFHNTIDNFNAWGTGYLEPFSSIRLTFGTIPIVDLVFWALMIGGFIFSRFKTVIHRPHLIFRTVGMLMFLHVMIQSLQGGLLYHQNHKQFEQVALSADFVPGQFSVIGKNKDRIEIYKGSLWSGLTLQDVLISNENTNLQPLFEKNPAAKTLYEWSPFVVIVDDEEKQGLFDPRFYRNGSSFLAEYVYKK